MNTNLSPEIAFYLELLVSVVAVVLAAGLYELLRNLIKNTLGKKPGSRAGLVFSRIALPAAVIVVAAILRIEAVRRLLPVRDGFGRAVEATFIFFVVFFFIRLVDALYRARYARTGRAVPLPRVLHGFILAVIYLAVFFALLKTRLGVNIGPFLTTSAILTAVLGLALQGVLGNILAGLSLHFTRAFGRGDWVKVGEVEGIIQETNWRETRVLDRSSNIVVFPNSAMASAVVTNFALPDVRTAIRIPIKLGPQASPGRVVEILKEAARESPDVVRDPAPTAYLLSYDETGISYLSKFWIRDYNRKFTIAGEVGRLIWAKFRREGIEVPVSVADKVEDVIGALRPGERDAGATALVERNLRDLGGSAFLRVQAGERAGEPVLSDAESRELAGMVGRSRFLKGEVLFRQGDKGVNCYLVASGKVRGTIETTDGGKVFSTAFEVGPGGIVGEMSLFTGMPRTATVIVDEEAELLEIRAESFAGLLSRNEKLAEAAAEVVSARNKQNLETLRKVKELSAQDLEAGTNKKSIVEYLKRMARLFRA